MNKPLHTIWIFLFAIGLLAPATAAANVGLTSFTAAPAADGIVLAWQTGSELDTAGFRLDRAEGDVWQPLAVGLIPAQGNPTLGAAYTVTDETAVPGISYRYRLIEVDVQAVERELAIVSATLPTAPTATPIVMQPPTAPTAVSDQLVSPDPTETPPPATVAPVELAPTPTPQREMPVVQAETAVDPPSQPQRPLTGVQIVSAAPDAAGSAAVVAPDRFRPPLQTTPESGYPAPTPTPAPPTPAESDAAYPAATPTVAAGSPTAYPVGTVNGVAATPITIIGEELPNAESASFSQANEAAAEPLTTTAGRLVLWSGFLISLAILGMAIFGAILFFTRRR